MGSIHEKTRAQKSRATVPLNTESSSFNSRHGKYGFQPC
jgi:hypothetical protein